MELVGRTREQDLLNRCLESKESEFVAVYGRRRVGKTFLVRQFFNNSFAFYATGLADSPMKDQLRVFRQALEEYSGRKVPALTTWLDGFRELIELLKNTAGPGKHVVFLDELPWFDTPRSGFVAGLEYFWNSYASARDDIILVTCGSATSWMIDRLLRNRRGLHNRVTRRIRLNPFTLAECEEFYRNRGIVMSRYQMVEAYMILGGVPYYLRQMDSRLSLAQNVDALCFADEAPLRDEYRILFASLFREPGRYQQVVEALAAKTSGLTREEILRSTGLSDGGTTSQTLTELEESGFVRRTTPFGATKRGAVYQLIDPFVLFHLSFMAQPQPPGFWGQFSVTPRHNAWAGLAFEQVCASHLPQIKQALGISGISATASSWRSKPAPDSPNAQIDLVIDRSDGCVNLCEMKYAATEFTVTSQYAATLTARRELFRAQTHTRKALFLTMVTPYGLTPNEYAATVQQSLTLDHLFMSGEPLL